MTFPQRYARPEHRRSLASRWGLDGRIGGPMGRHAWPRGRFFDPAPWAVLTATLVWLLAIYRMTPCIQHNVTKGVDPYQRLCYSDIPVIYQSSGMGHGAGLLRGIGIEQSPLVIALMALTRAVTGLVGGHVVPTASPQQVLDASNIYWGIAQIVLFAAFLGVVVAVMLMGRGSDHGVGITAQGRPDSPPRRSWDVFWVAASPSIYLAGLVDFTLVPVCLVMFSLLAWARRRPALAGMLIGLACAGSLQAGLVAFAVVVLCLRATRLTELGRYLVTAITVLAACHLVVLLISPRTWWRSFHNTFWSGTGLGTVWYIVKDSTGSIVPWVGWISGVLTAAGLIALAWFSLSTPRRPRLSQVACLAVIVFLLTAKVYSPQFVLLLIPLCVLARPDWRDWTVITITESLYFCAVWAHLGGLTMPGGSSSDVVYWVAIVLRLGGQVWFGWGILDDMRRPWVDSVRVGFTDDPTGGVLDHAPDGQDEAAVVEPEMAEVEDQIAVSREVGAGETGAPVGPGEPRDRFELSAVGPGVSAVQPGSPASSTAMAEDSTGTPTDRPDAAGERLAADEPETGPTR